MAKITSVGFWSDRRGIIRSGTVNYASGRDVRFAGRNPPDTAVAFIMKSKEKDVIHLSNGKTLTVFFN